jgi:hypothetical protein
MVNSSALYSQSALIRIQSRALAARANAAAHHAQSSADAAVLACTETRRLRAEAGRLEDLRRESLAEWQSLWSLLNQLELPDTASFADGEVFESQELVSHLNALGYSCEKCDSTEPLVAVVRFNSLETALGLCGNCYRELSGLALGHPV